MNVLVDFNLIGTYPIHHYYVMPPSDPTERTFHPTLLVPLRFGPGTKECDQPGLKGHF